MVEINLNAHRSKLARNILDHFVKYIKSNSLDVTMVEEYQIGGGLRIDFAFPRTSPKVFIEVDGIQHSKSVKHWGGDEALFDRQVNDRLKEERIFMHHDGVLLRFNHEYIGYKEFEERIKSECIDKILKGGDTQEDDIVDSKYYKKKKTTRKKLKL